MESASGGQQNSAGYTRPYSSQIRAEARGRVAQITSARPEAGPDIRIEATAPIFSAPGVPTLMTQLRSRNRRSQEPDIRTGARPLMRNATWPVAGVGILTLRPSRPIFPLRSPSSSSPPAPPPATRYAASTSCCSRSGETPSSRGARGRSSQR